MNRPICLGGAYTLAGILYTVVAITASTVIIRDPAGNQSQVHQVTFGVHFAPVSA